MYICKAFFSFKLLFFKLSMGVLLDVKLCDTVLSCSEKVNNIGHKYNIDED